MKIYEIVQGNKGYIIRDAFNHRASGGFSEQYAFSTLSEVRAFLPNIFEPKPQKVKPSKVSS